MLATRDDACKRRPNLPTSDSGAGVYNQAMGSRTATQLIRATCRTAAGLQWPALAVASLMACLPTSALAQVQGYRLDPVHTRVLFSISHAGYSQAIGTVSGSQGMLAFDPEDWQSAKLSVEVPLQRMDMGDAKWTQAVVARRFLDVARYPVATFVSSRIEAVDGETGADSVGSTGHGSTANGSDADDGTSRHARVCGTLTLHGVGRDLCLDVTFNKLKHYPLPPFRTTVGFSATGTLKRSDFGITAWKSLVGDEVHLRIEAEAQRDGDALDAIDANPPSADSAAVPEHTENTSAPDAPAP